MKNKTLISSLAPLRPTNILNLKTGEQYQTPTEHDKNLNTLIKHVQQQTTLIYKKQHQNLITDIQQATKIGSPNSFARQRGYTSNYKNLPKNILAKSRINELILHKLISETSSYTLNPNPRKQPPNFSPKINLGAIDKQMSSLSQEDNTLTLRFKVWELDLLIDFQIPEYVSKRNILKWSLPTIELRGGVPYYIFSIQEIPKIRKKSNLLAGLDLGRRVPASFVVATSDDRLIARYEVSGRVRALNGKRERLLVEKHQIVSKALHYESLGLNSSVLRREARLVARKASVLGDEVSRQVGAFVVSRLARHDVNVLNVEDLSWVRGSRFGGRWAHSKTQSAIEHAVSREGIRVKKVNAAFTSKVCHKCGGVVSFDLKKRLVLCALCRESFDRDFNAAMNIALNKNVFPTDTVGSGVTVAPGQVTSQKAQTVNKEDFLQEIQLY